jgi:hypothetical protein
VVAVVEDITEVVAVVVDITDLVASFVESVKKRGSGGCGGN